MDRVNVSSTCQCLRLVQPIEICLSTMDLDTFSIHQPSWSALCSMIIGCVPAIRMHFALKFLNYDIMHGFNAHFQQIDVMDCLNTLDLRTF